MRLRKQCLICKSDNFKFITTNVRDSKKHRLAKCQKCSHVQLFPFPLNKELKKINDENLQDENIGYYGTIENYREKNNENTIRRGNLVSKLVKKNAKILEIGSGHGFFLEYMNNLGYDIIGIEISEEKRILSNKVSSVSILNVDLKNKVPKIGPYDLIAMFHILEHLENPIDFLTQARKLVKTRGKVVIEVPNFEDLQMNVNKAYRMWEPQLSHLHYFTPRTLRKVLQKAGFKKITIKGVQRYGIENMFHWRIMEKPQLERPSLNMPKEYEWLEKFYKNYLEKQLLCDAIVAVGST